MLITPRAYRSRTGGVTAKEINGQETRVLVDQIRSIDTGYLIGDPVHYLELDELAEGEQALARYLGL